MMKNNLVSNLRKLFIDFFAKNGHQVFPSSPLILKDDPSLLFTNAGMVQFKQMFTNPNNANVNTATSSQKCLRVGGKHNDLENVGYTNRHHTFFEMLGNFSFGSYFKEGAIEFAWNFVIKELSLSKDRLYFTVYHDDQEAFDLWKKISGVSDSRIIKITTSDNFWSMGNTGPCGPCSEIFYDYGDNVKGGLPGTPEEDGARFTEIWNLVFMQYDRKLDGELCVLPKKCIDTGMGLERIAAVMQGVHDNYDISLFKALIAASKEQSGNSTNELAHRVIADHVRSAAFLIAEGLTPGNEGRNYILRRIIRRAARYVYMLKYDDALMYKVFPTLIDEESCGYMADYYPELIHAKDLIMSILKIEEENFKDTLVRALPLLEKELMNLSSGDILSGDIVFKLYDTYGFPVDITLDIIKEKGVKFDEQGFYDNMNKQKERSKLNHSIKSDQQLKEEFWVDIKERCGSTKFVGYERYDTKATVLSIVCGGDKNVEIANVGDKVSILLDITPFYAESGGQKGDVGIFNVIVRQEKELFANDNIAEVIDTKKVLDTLYIHECIIKQGSLMVGDVIFAKIDCERRRNLCANHSATHLLHYVLKSEIDSSIMQKGSLVSDEKLRFDFSYGVALTKEQLTLIEDKMYSLISGNNPVISHVCDLKDAVAGGAVALFTEKYEEHGVRVVSIKDSKELCCGTHVKYTSEIGCFKIVSEASIACGIRRIEAVTGRYAIDYFRQQEKMLNSIAESVKVPVDNVLVQIDKLDKKNQELEQKLSDVYFDMINLQGVNTEKIGNVDFLYSNLSNIPVNVMRKFINKHLTADRIILFANVVGQNVVCVVGVGNSLHCKVKAVDFVKMIGTMVKSKGGGNAQLAQINGEYVKEIDIMSNVKSKLVDILSN
ncbi:alanine--tRNA ligase [Ehrlichia chaffeensis]|uniref:alanine--tRNA ligase n=1 Tax=Ehrlichia chaffeensis TaxID=945 RepID=UPI000444B706|nr:alanine--tRNA ligase [Ehrlichia chaffeensis]AHX09708.1 alanine--tRNA ligase [Ehrlichia chaffeensis str. Wakulla]